MSKIKKLKVKSDGTLSDYIKIGADASDVDLTDGSTVQEAINELNDIVINDFSAATHNGFYRGRDLTSYFNSGQMSTDLANGNFHNIFPGDYIIKTKVIDGKTWTDRVDMIAECDPYYNKYRGTSSLGNVESHHVGIITYQWLGIATMNTSATTAGGFKGSEMWTTTLPKYLEGYKNAYGDDHLVDFGVKITSSVNDTGYNKSGSATGCSSNSTWVNTKITLMSENQVFGGSVWGSSGHDPGEAVTQLACFRLNPALINFNGTLNEWWLRDIAQSGYFCCANAQGYAGYYTARFPGCMRPLLLLK